LRFWFLRITNSDFYL